MLTDLLNLRFKSSSDFVNEKAVFPVLSKLHGYETLEECYEDRVNHRPEWFNLLRAYNGEDPARLGRELFAEYDVYCGLRNREEFQAMKRAGLFDLVIWVDASERLPLETSDSMELCVGDADIVIDNNADLNRLTLITTKTAFQLRNG
jgi:hypothetical protein